MKIKVFISICAAALMSSVSAAPSTVFTVGSTHTFKTGVALNTLPDGTIETKYQEISLFEGSTLTKDENGNCNLITTIIEGVVKVRADTKSIEGPTTRTVSHTFSCPKVLTGK